MTTLQDNIEFTKQATAIVDQMLASADWESSIFLRNAVKPIRELSDQAKSVLAQAEAIQTTTQEQAIRTIPEGHTKVYIGLYQADGQNMAKWASTLHSLHDYSANRPVYGSLADIEAVIRAKAKQSTVGYVTVIVNNNEIIPAYRGRATQDLYGHELLTLTEQAVEIDNIIEFVHLGKHYRYVDGKLEYKEKKQ